MKAWVQMTSGKGPEECCWAVAQLLKIFSTDSKKNGFDVELLDAIDGYHPNTLKSVLLSIEGKSIEPFLDSWEGTIQWRGQSPFRVNHRRKNWFIGVNVFYPPKDNMAASSYDIKYESMKASGPGGQHVNKTCSAVRAIHIPSGITTTAQEERSQFMNKKLATTKLLKILNSNAEQKKQDLQQDIWHQHNCLERGNPKRTYKGVPMKLIRKT